MDGRKIIYLARHAKSSWNSGAQTDFDRPLSERGSADALLMGKALKELGWKPERIISSPAIRAKITCRTLCDTFNFPFDDVIWNRDIYAAYTVTLLQILSQQSESIKSVMLIGHNPAIEDLLLHFCHDALPYRQKNGKLFTTGNIVKISVASSWKELAMCDAKIEQFLRPKEL